MCQDTLQQLTCHTSKNRIIPTEKGTGNRAVQRRTEEILMFSFCCPIEWIQTIWLFVLLDNSNDNNSIPLYSQRTRWTRAGHNNMLIQTVPLCYDTSSHSVPSSRCTIWSCHLAHCSLYLFTIVSCHHVPVCVVPLLTLSSLTPLRVTTREGRTFVWVFSVNKSKFSGDVIRRNRLSMKLR